ncbi:MAG: tyrosine-type recombinase/integrase [Bacteroidota bacterium]|nr:tyrosine-type recombinase/integrase [Bacteroidota bacterium]
MPIIEEFREYLFQLGYGKKSRHILPHNVREFLEFIKDTHEYLNDELQWINSQHINMFYDWLQIRPNKRKEGGLSEIMISHYIYSLRIFFKYLEITEQINFNPISAMKFKRPKTRRREPLTQNEIKELFGATQTLKEKVILHLFYSLGLRRSEAESLNINDIHLNSGMMYVREGKGQKRRAIPLTPKVKKDIENYFNKERKIIKNLHDTEAFIISRTGYRMTGNNLNRIFKDILGRTKINKPETSLHHLRHSIATHLLENGLSVEYVRDFLGHTHLEATQVYVSVSKEQILNCDF